MIYIIDDDKSVKRAFELFLKSAGMEFMSFENANDFLSKIRPVSEDILILDLNLPGMNGCDLLKKLDHDGMHLAVIVVTAFEDTASRETCKEYGVRAYLRKPVDGEALIDIINSGIS